MRLKHLHKFYNAQVLHKLWLTNNRLQHVTSSHLLIKFLVLDYTPVYARVFKRYFMKMKLIDYVLQFDYFMLLFKFSTNRLHFQY